MQWTDKQPKAFTQLKEKLMQTPVLYLYEITFEVSMWRIIHCVGAVLSHIVPDQSEYPIVYASRTLNYLRIKKVSTVHIWKADRIREATQKD